MSELDLATEPDELTYEDWAKALREGTLLGQRCGDCAHVTGAPKAACARCGSLDLETIELSTTGEVFTETRLEVVPEGYERPHHVVLVSLGDARVMAHVPEAVEIGQQIELTDTLEVDGAVAPVFEPN
ncbi:Zn-ribbon domain-containing OB-fold protein [Natronorubrum tibetense]|uniref:ChsH2 rubredoxin-like zinc ribbon domain-containing protein n=1 Tax=Natronorubrum tibetense GA33 TaxID=1114856 RepID=L9VL08_9EURY|nr:zinc ribbon domain-containing protein [Natronorubrum tibetense]ELY37751.1 hypothetical protein C496_19625 [Natronorubrum tibetense GA33]